LVKYTSYLANDVMVKCEVLEWSVLVRVLTSVLGLFLVPQIF